MGMKKYKIMWQEKGGRTVKIAVRPQELIYRDTKDQIVECTEQFLDDYVSNPNALTTIRYRVTGDDNDKENDEDSFRKVRIIGYARDEESRNETEMKENETLGRGKRIMKKKIDIDTPDTLVVKRNCEREKAAPTSSEDNSVKDMGKQLLTNKRDLDNAKGTAGEDALKKLELKNTEILPEYDDNDDEEESQSPKSDSPGETGSVKSMEACNGASRGENSNDEGLKEVESSPKKGQLVVVKQTREDDRSSDHQNAEDDEQLEDHTKRKQETQKRVVSLEMADELPEMNLWNHVLPPEDEENGEGGITGNKASPQNEESDNESDKVVDKNFQNPKSVPKAHNKIVVKKIESCSGIRGKIDTIIANITKERHSESTAVTQETPVQKGKLHVSRNLEMTDSNSNIIGGSRKGKSLGKKGNRCYDKRWKENIAATGKDNVKQPKRSCDVATSDAYKSTLPVISKGRNKTTKKVMPPFNEPGTSSMQEIRKRKREDSLQFESEEDVPRSTKKLKTQALPVQGELKGKGPRKSVRAKERVTAGKEKTHNKNTRIIVESANGRKNDEDEETATGVASSERRKEALSEMAAEFNILAKQMIRFAKKFTNLCELDSDDESQFKIVGLENEDDDEIEVAPNWKLPRETVAKAGLSNSMTNRLGILVRSLWDEKTRKELTTKKDGKGEAGKKRVSYDEAKLIMNVCYSLQGYKKLPLNEVQTVEDTMQAIGKKLSYDRYNLIRYQKHSMNKQTHVDKASRKNRINSDYDASSSDDDGDKDEEEDGNEGNDSSSSSN